MNDDSRSLWPAVVDIERVRFSKGKELGFDFSNEIDTWTQIEFKFRQQIQYLRQTGTFMTHENQKEMTPLLYAVREKL